MRLLLLAASLCAGQTFEVAAIRASAPDAPAQLFAAENGQLSVRGYTLRTLIQMGWNVRDVEVVGGPTWVASARFDVTAKGDPGATDAQLRLMVQALLGERFRLVLHTEMRELPAYALMIHKDGLRIRESEAASPDMQVMPGQIRGTKVRLSILAQTLSRQLDRPVLDKTGLGGRYDFDLQWTPLEQVNGTGPSIFTAVQELGLRLEEQKAPVPVLVIDSVERPSEN